MVEPGELRIVALRAVKTSTRRTQIKAPVDLTTLLDTATDGLRFVTEFFEVISKSAPHIYHSALPLTPPLSIIRKLYSEQIPSGARVVTGIPASWDSCIAMAGAASELYHATWSPCGQYIAVGSGSGIEVRDSTTLEVSYVLKPPSFLDLFQHFLTFSPDGHLLICVYLQRRSGLSPSFISVLMPTPRTRWDDSKMSVFIIFFLIDIHPIHFTEMANSSLGIPRQVLSLRSSVPNLAPSRSKRMDKRCPNSSGASTLFSGMIQSMPKHYARINGYR